MEPSHISERFSKAEKLCNQKLIEELFDKGNSLYVNPLKLLYIKKKPATGSPVQVLIAVPKKYIKKATDRNKIKRLLRETYRKQKHLLFEYLTDRESGFLLAFVYVKRELIDYGQMEAVVIKALEQLIKEEKKSCQDAQMC